MTEVRGLQSQGRADKPALSYDESKALAKHADPEVRRRLASRSDVQPEILYFLADDPSPEVRRALAANKLTPRQADLLLARDNDPVVRSDLAAKIARVAPDLSQMERDTIRKMTSSAMETLARDEVTRVRQVLSEALQDVVDAPPAVIRRLASDAELVVSGPILESSPVLTDEDLVEIICAPPAVGALTAIARRSTVNESVSDALAASDDVEAIAALLGNSSAQIREETLDDLVERSVNVTPWQAPLVHRPRLPAAAAKRLAQFVADSLIETLEQRDDLPAEALERVRQEAQRRLGEGNPDGDPQASPDGEAAYLARAARMQEGGQLTDATISAAVDRGEHRFVAAALVIRTEIPMRVIESVMAQKIARGITALAWKAGMTMAAATDLQKRCAKVPLALMVKPSAKGTFPMSETEMDWQLELMSNVAQ